MPGTLLPIVSPSADHGAAAHHPAKRRKQHATEGSLNVKSNPLGVDPLPQVGQVTASKRGTARSCMFFAVAART